MKARYGELANKVRELAARPEGVSQREAADALNRHVTIASVYIATMVKLGEAIRAGAAKNYRYFKDPVTAAGYDKESKERMAAQMKATRERLLARRAEKEREKRAKARQQRGLRPIQPKTLQQKTETFLKPNSKSIGLQTRQQAFDKKLEHKEAKVVWPEHVQVQVCPTYQDMRFRAAPGYKGEFLKEWQEKRAA